MRKEIILAIIAGAVFGAVIAFGIWRANTALKPKITTPSPTLNEVSSETEESSQLRLTLAQPEEKDVVTESPTVISGITRQNTWMAISAEEKDHIIKSSNDGSFEQEVDLAGGLNQILIMAFDEDGAFVEEKLTVVFSTEFFKDNEESEPQEESSPEDEEATEAADAVREKVQEKVEEARKNPKAYLGTVTDIVEETVQIKSEEGEIQQLSVNEEETALVKMGKTKTTVKYSDVALGDFIIALGYKNTNEVLETTRILLTEAPEPSTRKALFGEVAEIAKREVTIKQADGSIRVVQFGNKWVGPELDELEEGTKIIVVGTTEENTLSVRTLFIIPKEIPEEPSPTPEEKP